jgi:hypothetical protein
MRQYKGCCHFANCRELATHGFKSQRGRIQVNKYCYIHAKQMQQQKVFPNCELVSIRK